MTAAEDIRPIPLAPGYFANADGRIFSERRGSMKERKQTPVGRYLGLVVSIDRKPRFRGSHRLICSAFHGLPPDGQEARHIDGDPRNNVATNLVWGTHSQNERDKERHGTGNQHDGNGRALMSDEMVARVKQLLAARRTQSSLARELGVKKSTICAIATGVNWESIPGEMPDRTTNIGEKHYLAKLTNDDVRAIRVALRSRANRPTLAAKYGVSVSLIAKIATGKIWKHVLDADPSGAGAKA